MASFTPRLTSNGILYGQTYAGYYWNHDLNPYALRDYCMANCTTYAYGRALEIGSPAPLVTGAYPSAFKFNSYLANGWTAIPWNINNVEPGDILQYGDYYRGISGCHVSFVEAVNGPDITTSNSNFRDRNTALTMDQICDYFQTTEDLRKAFFCIKTWTYGGTPTYILKNPGNTPGPTPPPGPGPDPEPGETVQYPIAIGNKWGLKVGDKVKIIGTGKAAADGSGGTAYGLGWIRYIQGIYESGEYPFRVGFRNSNATTGFYKGDALLKLN